MSGACPTVLGASDDQPARYGAATDVASAMVYAAVMTFSPDDLGLLAATDEIEIETTRADGSRRRTIIWVMTDGPDVYVRSVRGEAGRWYQEALADPRVIVHAPGRAIAVRAAPATDDDAIARCSAAITRKYAGRSGYRPMLRRQVLATTLRLDPA